ncbi:heparinase II/III domain-containing protein [Pseudoduganella chitinolytica]|uniref:Heparinase II/III family protein n=1 Tax=Pseudoduganella chitinolytica TaxID=34070 RepID=A0ABY8BJT8_9BURK|nr:heparinase II/III family protein [Pseudoduganella chitinolytica]WEF35673.1 heparinase II/III family protein [Pseudoduganella chitinolytica]
MRTQVQNPPTFAWPRHSTNPASYVLEIRSGTTVVKTFTAFRNWYLPALALQNGTYTWRVRPSTLTDWSSDRTFVIGTESLKFEVPEDDVLVQRIQARARPRGLQAGLPLYKDWPAEMRAERGTYMTRMINGTLNAVTTLADVSDAQWPLVTGKLQTAENAAQNASIRNAISAITRQMEQAGLLYRLTGETRYLTEAIRRGDNLASLSPTGPTSYENQDQATRAISLSLMKTVDMLAGALDSTRRARWVENVRVRGNAIYGALALSKGDMDQYPLDSHSGTNIGFLALTATLAIGEFAEAKTWFNFSYRAYVSSLSPWSGPEGGFANGTAYGEYTIDLSLVIWQPLAQATGVNLLDKPWTKGFLNFFMQMMPPGSKNHLFGDAHETAPDMRYMKALALRFKTPEAAWYARNLPGIEDPLSYLQGPYPMPANTVATPTPPANAVLFPSIGWAAFHSNMADANRTSVYFKSSPYGSFNHSHGDQNSFVLKKGGIPLITESGYYDWYDSPNWNNWYRQTKAHNAVTYDGGIGQYITGWREPRKYNGSITSYGDYGNTYFVAGNAAPAFGGALTQNTRRVWYMRNTDTVVVHDTLAANVPRTYEWNFHTLAPIVANTNGTTQVTYQGKTVCLRSLTSGTRFEKRSGGLVKAGTMEEHGTYVRTTAATKAEFVVLLDVGCKNTPYSITETASGRTLTVGRDVLALPR